MCAFSIRGEVFLFMLLFRFVSHTQESPSSLSQKVHAMQAKGKNSPSSSQMGESLGMAGTSHESSMYK